MRAGPLLNNPPGASHIPCFFDLGSELPPCLGCLINFIHKAEKRPPPHPTGKNFTHIYIVPLRFCKGDTPIRVMDANYPYVIIVSLDSAILCRAKCIDNRISALTRLHLQMRDFWAFAVIRHKATLRTGTSGKPFEAMKVPNDLRPD